MRSVIIPAAAMAEPLARSAPTRAGRGIPWSVPLLRLSPITLKAPSGRKSIGVRSPYLPSTAGLILEDMMKKALAVIVLVSFPLITCAESISCEMLGTFAEIAMSARQGGTPMGNVFRMADGFRNKFIPRPLHSSFTTLAKTIITDAYSAPKYNTYEVQTSESVEFGNQIMLACVKQLEKPVQGRTR